MEKEGDLVLKILKVKTDFDRAITDLIKEGYKYLSFSSAAGAEVLEKRKDYQLVKLPNNTIGLIYEGNHYAHIYSKESPKIKSGCGGDCNCDKDKD